MIFMTKTAIRMMEKTVAKERTVMSLLEVDIALPATGGLAPPAAAALNGVAGVAIM